MLGLLTALVTAVGCSTTPEPPPAIPPVEGYLVGAPDALRIHVLPEPELERSVIVRPDGMISVDLVGEVQAAGRTPVEIANEIQERIGRFKRDAVVSVSVEASPSRFVTIDGEVRDPGTFPLDAQTRVSEAIGRVGGTTPFANLDAIRLIRSARGETEVVDVDLDAISHGDLSSNIIVEQGDLIVVPPTILARIGYAFQQLMFPLQPFLSGASQAGATYSGVRALD